MDNNVSSKSTFCAVSFLFLTTISLICKKKEKIRALLSNYIKNTLHRVFTCIYTHI